MNYIEQLLNDFEDDFGPSATVQESRPMFANGQLVQPNNDGSRPGYAGDPVESNIRSSPTGNAYEVNIQRGPEIFNQTFNKRDYKNKSEALNAARKFRDQKKQIPFKTGIQEPKYGSGLNQKEYMKIYNEATRDLTESGKLAGERNLKLKNFIGKKKKIKASVLRDFILKDIGYENYDATKIKKKFPNLTIEKDIKTGSEYKPLTKQQIIKVKDNFDLPEGEKWDFKKYKNGLNGEKYPNLVNQIRSRVTDPKSYKIAANFSDPQGWMMSSMNRVYENEKKNKVKPKDRTYQPKFNNRGIIVGFTDNTETGQGRTFYGLKKNMREDGTEWRAHGDFSKVDKFIDIANGVKENPNKILQKILNDKGLNSIKGLTLNDVLSHQRYFSKLSETAPQELLKRQVVLHHTKGVGAGSDIARAAATKDLQLLSGAVNSNVNALEQIVRGTSKTAARKLNADEIEKLKNYGAKITDLDGKVVGGGSLDPNKQYANIEKGALKYAQSKDFNVKSVASYLERLGCGKAAGGRVYYNEGAFGLTKCAQKGQRVLTEGLEKGFKKGTQATLATAILKAGKGLKDVASIRGLLGPAALGFIAAEQGAYVGYDMLSKGKSFKEAIGDSAFNYLAGDKTKVDPIKERNKRMIEEGMTPEQMGKIGAMESTFDRINYGNSLLNKIDTIKNNRNLISMNPEDAFNEKALQSSLDKKEDETRTNLREFYRGDTNFGADIEGGQEALAEGLRRNELAQLQSVDNIFQSRKGDDYRTARKRKLMLQNPDILNYMGPYPTTLGFAGGGIAKIAGDRSGPPPQSGPNSQGLQGLFNRVMKIKE